MIGSDTPQDELIAAVLANQSPAVAEFLSRLAPDSVENWIYAASNLRRETMTAMLRDPAAFMAYKSPDLLRSIDQALFQKLIQLSIDGAQGGQELHDTLFALDLHTLNALMSLCGRFESAKVFGQIQYVTTRSGSSMVSEGPDNRNGL